MFIDDIVLVVSREMGEKWIKALKGQLLVIRRSKTRVIMIDFVESYRAAHIMQMDDDKVCEVDRFKYLGFIVSKKGGSLKDVENRIVCE